MSIHEPRVPAADVTREGSGTARHPGSAGRRPVALDLRLGISINHNETVVRARALDGVVLNHGETVLRGADA